MSALGRLVLVSLLGACATTVPQAAEKASPVRMGLTAFRHVGGILDFQFAPGGKFLASIGADQTLRLWEFPGGRELFTVRAEYHLTALAFGNGGSTLALVGNSSEVRFFDVPSGKERTPVHTFERRLHSLAFAPKGEVWAAGGDTAILLWENGTEGKPEVLIGHRRGAFALTFSPDGQTLASAGVEDYACLWTLPKPGKPDDLAGPRFVQVSALAFSPDGRSLSAGGADSNVRLWNAEARAIGTTFAASGGIRSLAWSPDGKSIAAGIGGSDVILWDVARPGQPRKFTSKNHETRRVSFSPDGTVLAAAGTAGSIRFWSVADGQAVTLADEGHRSAVTAIAVRRPSGPIVTASRDGEVLFWDLSGRKLGGHEHDGLVRALAVSPEEGLLASAGNDRYIRLWHFESGRLLTALDGTDGSLRGLAFTPPPTELLVAESGRIQAWSLRTRTFRETLIDSVAPESLVLDQSGRRAIWADARRGIGVIDLVGERRLRYLEGHEGSVQGVACAGDAVASVGTDGSLRVWDAETRASSLSRSTGPLLALGCSQDGRTALTGGDDGHVRLWELASG